MYVMQLIESGGAARSRRFTYSFLALLICVRGLHRKHAVSFIMAIEA